MGLSRTEAREARIRPRRLEYYAKGRTLVFDEATQQAWLVDDEGRRNRRQPEVASNAGNSFSVWYDPVWLEPSRLRRLEALCWRLDQRRQRYWQETAAALRAALVAVGGIADWVSPEGDVMRYFITSGSGGYQIHPTPGWIEGAWVSGLAEGARPWIPGPRDQVLHPELGAKLRALFVTVGPMRNTHVLTVCSILDRAIRRECARRWPDEGIPVGRNVRLTINDRAYHYVARRQRDDDGPGAVFWSLVSWPLFEGWDTAEIP